MTNDAPGPAEPVQGDDPSLMRRFQAGDEEAFQAIFQRYAALLVNFARRSLNSREESEDLAQEVLLRVYRSKDRFDASRPFRPWVFSIAVRLISNRLRDGKRHPRASLDGRPEEEGRALDLPDKPVSRPEQSAEKERLVQVVQRALDALPENQRTAVTLVRFHDLSYEEVAQAMDLSVGAVKSLLFRSRQALKEALSAHVP